MNLDQELIQKTLTFETYDGVLWRNYKLLSILDPATVLALGYDAPAKHIQHYPFLPAGTSDNWQDYMYAKFSLAGGTVEYLGVPWVKPTSIVINDNPSVNILVRNPSPQQLTSLRSMMVASGIEDFEISYI